MTSELPWSPVPLFSVELSPISKTATGNVTLNAQAGRESPTFRVMETAEELGKCSEKESPPANVPRDSPGTSEDSVTCHKQGRDLQRDEPPPELGGRVVEPDSLRANNRTEEKPEEVGGEHPLPEQTLHGQPITISQCVFQAHIGRARTVAEARAVCEAVSAMIERDAAFSDFVSPFAFRLAHVRGARGHAPKSIGDISRAPNNNADAEEGFCDNGDVGSGEKLLYLLQKWDVRQRVLIVTRINGGFMCAELMGIRRYKFVVDRAKKLLENTDLVSLRRAVDTDIHPPPSPEKNTDRVVHDAAVNGRHHLVPEDPCRIGIDTVSDGYGVVGVPKEDSWDRFAVPPSSRRRTPDRTVCGNLLRAPQVVVRGARSGGGGVRPRGKCIPWSTRARERRALPLAHMSISSKTVPFPRGHVASMMGAKGYGKKRGRINHFAVRTPDSPVSEDSNGGGSNEGATAHGPGPEDPRDAESFDGRLAMASGWSLPRELDPTSTTNPVEGNGYGGAVTREGSTRGWANCSTHTAAPSRASTCDTIDSPSRVATIMLGVMPGMSKDHPLHPPPPTVNGKAFGATVGRYHPRAIHRELPSDGNGSTSSGGFSSVAFSPIDTASSRAAGGRTRRRQHGPLQPGGGASTACYSCDDAASMGGMWPHCPSASGRNGGGGGVGVGASGSGSYASSAGAAAGYRRVGSVGKGGYPFPSGHEKGGGVEYVGGGGSSHGKTVPDGRALPFLHRMPGSGVRDEPSPTLVVVEGLNSVGGGGAGPMAPPLSNESSMGRWKSNSPSDDSVSSTSITGGGAAAPLAEDALAGYTPGNRAESIVVDPENLLGGTTFIANSAGGERGLGGHTKERDSPATWASDSLPDATFVPVSGRSAPPPTRSKSALRGWSGDRAALACSPLVTEKRFA